MSERIYAWLLRLYPARFRATYGEDALQLFRDRSRDERGFFPGLQLWLDLLADLAVSVPGEYGHAQPALIRASAQRSFEGTPSFLLLEGEWPRPGTVLYAVFLALAVFGVFPILISHGGSHPPPGGWAESTRYTEEAIAAPGTSPAPQPATPGAAGLDPAERQRVITAVIANLRKYYVDPDVGRKMADALQAHRNSGEYNAVADGQAFADLLTAQMREVSHDLHLVMVYSRVPLPDHPAGPAPEEVARYRKAMEERNCTFEKVAILPHNIGYLKLNSFPDLSVCQPAATAAMASLNRADAIIFDLRDNTGGEPDMVMLIAAYLFDHPEYWYNPRENTTERSWTQSPVPGNRLADKPAYVLTSGSTWSAAEQFSYDVKMLKRATLVGETTRGGAHAGVFHRIDDPFGMGIPEVRAINPFAKTDWEGTGVAPDVTVKAADALETAEKLAESRLQK
jgi:hypothetical protein